MIPWILKYLKSCNSKSMMHTAKYMNQILTHSLNAYDELFQEINVENLVEKRNNFMYGPIKNLKSRNLEIKVRDELGVKQKKLTKNDILDLEPNLNQYSMLEHFYDYAYHARDPHGILTQIFKLFIAKGGKFKKSGVSQIKQVDEKTTEVSTFEKKYIFEKIVLACEAFSKN